MKNPSDKIKYEIKKWFENRGYGLQNLIIVNDISADISKKVSEEYKDIFEKEFKCQITIRGVSYDKWDYI